MVHVNNVTSAANQSIFFAVGASFMYSIAAVVHAVPDKNTNTNKKVFKNTLSA